VYGSQADSVEVISDMLMSVLFKLVIAKEIVANTGRGSDV
jgi:hypothetical protein